MRGSQLFIQAALKAKEGHWALNDPGNRLYWVSSIESPEPQLKRMRPVFSKFDEGESLDDIPGLEPLGKKLAVIKPTGLNLGIRQVLAGPFRDTVDGLKEAIAARGVAHDRQKLWDAVGV